MTKSRPAEGLQIRINKPIAMPQSEDTHVGCNTEATRTPSGFDCLRFFRDGSNAIRSMVTDLSTIALHSWITGTCEHDLVNMVYAG